MDLQQVPIGWHQVAQCKQELCTAEQSIQKEVVISSTRSDARSRPRASRREATAAPASLTFTYFYYAYLRLLMLTYVYLC